MAQKTCLLELLLSPEASKSTSHSLSLSFSPHLVRLFITLGLKRGGLMAEKLRSQGLDPDGVTLESLNTRHVDGGTVELAWERPQVVRTPETARQAGPRVLRLGRAGGPGGQVSRPTAERGSGTEAQRVILREVCFARLVFKCGVCNSHFPSDKPSASCIVAFVRSLLGCTQVAVGFARPSGPVGVSLGLSNLPLGTSAAGRFQPPT